MKKSKFTESQIVTILKEADAGMKVADVCRTARRFVSSVMGIILSVRRFDHRPVPRVLADSSPIRSRDLAAETIAPSPH
jgi:hypothetical protein